MGRAWERRWLGLAGPRPLQAPRIARFDCPSSPRLCRGKSRPERGRGEPVHLCSTSCHLGALAVMVATFIPSGVGAECMERALGPRLSVSRFIESPRTREAWAMLICRMQKGKLRFGEASTNPRPQLVRAGVTRVRQARPRARTAASHAISLGKQFTSQAGRPAWDWLPRSIGGSRMTQLHPHPRQPGVWPRLHG